MKRTLAAITLIAGFSMPALADCKSEVEAAFNMQHQQKTYRSNVTSQTDQGTQEQQFDYMPPDKLYRKVTSPASPEPVEVIGIGRWAWNNEGHGWTELEPQFAGMVSAHLQETFGAPVKVTTEYKCLGKLSFEGKEYAAYQTLADAGAPADALVRTVYVDAATGLPAFNNVGPAQTDVKPVVREAFSYPADIDIQPPFNIPGGAGATP